MGRFKFGRKRDDYDPEESVDYDVSEEEDYIEADMEEEEEAPAGPRGRARGPKISLSGSDMETVRILSKFLMPVGICFAAAVLCMLIVPKLIGDRSEELQGKIDRYASLSGEKDALDLELRQMQNAKEHGNLTGVYSGRENDAQWVADDEKAQVFFSGITTWSDGETYDEIRKKMLSDGYVETDSLMVCFLPKMNDGWDTDPESETHNQYVREIDKKGLNQSFDGMTSYRLYSDGSQSRYAAIVEISLRDRTGTGRTVSAKAYVKYTVDAASGSMSNVEAYVLDND